MECSLLTATRGSIDDTGILPAFTVRQCTTSKTKLKQSSTVAILQHTNIWTSPNFSPIRKEPFNSRVWRSVTRGTVHKDSTAEIAPCGYVQIISIDSKPSNQCPIIYSNETSVVLWWSYKQWQTGSNNWFESYICVLL